MFMTRLLRSWRADQRVVRSHAVVSTTQGDHTILLDIKGGHYYTLNEVGSRIWSLAANPITADQIAEQLEQEYETTVSRLLPDVHRYVRDLRSARLLVRA